MPAHYWTYDFSSSKIEASIKRLIETGVEISISELDIPLGFYNNYTQRTAAPSEEEERLQTDLYEKTFLLFKKYSDSITRVTFWGKSDSQSWRFEGYPLIFDKDFAPKKEYFAVMSVVENYHNLGV